MRSWTKEAVHSIDDDVLVRSLIEFRAAIRLLEDSDLAAGNRYADEMKKGIDVMETELSRRGLGRKVDKTRLEELRAAGSCFRRTWL